MTALRCFEASLETSFAYFEKCSDKIAGLAAFATHSGRWLIE
jgi:hypothetical protein